MVQATNVFALPAVMWCMTMNDQEEHELWVCILILAITMIFLFPVGIALCGSALRTWLLAILSTSP